MISFIRNSSFMKAFSFLMAISIFTISCDPNGDLLVQQQIDDQAEKILNDYSGFMSESECAQFKNSIEAVKTFVWQQRTNGVSPTREDLANFVYNLSVQNGTLTASTQSQKEAFVNLITDNHWGGEYSSIIPKLVEEQYFSQDMADALSNFKANLDGVQDYNQAYQVIETMRTSSVLQNLSTNEQAVFQEALNAAEKTVCYEETTQNDVQTRGWCEECSWTMHWEALVISIIVTVAAFLVSWLSFGLASGWAATITITVWAAVWTYVCIEVWCDEEEPCPDGQMAECEGSFTFDPDIPACTSDRFPSNAMTFNGCIFIPIPANGCPPGSSPGTQFCELECFSVEPVKNSDGNWQLPFTCR